VTWYEALLSLQLLAEERVGFVIRERARMAREAEDAAWAAAVEASRGNS
jgi:hypothetical protein